MSAGRDRRKVWWMVRAAQPLNIGCRGGDDHAFRSCVDCVDFTLYLVGNIERIAVSGMFASAMIAEVWYG